VRGRRDTTTCAAISGNTATTGGGGAGLSVSEANTAVFEIQSPNPVTPDANAVTFLANQNPGAVNVQAVSVANNFVAIGTCPSIPS